MRNPIGINDEWIRHVTVTMFLVCLSLSGCSRLKYVQRADRDAYSILGYRTAVDPHSASTDISIIPSPLSRLFDPTPIDAPVLPVPSPQLHSYPVPEGVGVVADNSAQPEEYQQGPILPAMHKVAERGPRMFNATAHAVNRLESDDTQPRILLTRLAVQTGIPEPHDQFSVAPLTVPGAAWDSVPPECRQRIFDFSGIRQQYEETFGKQPPIEERDDSLRLRFEDVLYLAMLNSREYQAQKEQLYRVALRLTLEQYDYQLKFAPFGNSTGTRFEHLHSNAGSQSDLQIPSQAQLEILAATGTSFITRFANDVLLTFNGPDGFAADIGSEMLFGLTHSVFQNDVRFESLTQAERNVIYAAREFSRFRRTYYLRLATQYYNLLRNYRQIEIDAQNYLSLVRVYGQREVEFASGEVARVQMDQVEQNALSARSSLIADCNLVENAVDQLKISMGLPTETTIQLDLSELQSLTRGDERLVKLQLVRRVATRLEAELERPDVDEATLLNIGGELVARLREAAELGDHDGTDFDPSELNQLDLKSLAQLQAWLRAAERRAIAAQILSRLQTSIHDPNAPVIRVPELAIVYARNIVELLGEELKLAESMNAEPSVAAAIQMSRDELMEQLTKYETFLGDLLGRVQIDQLAEARTRAEQLVTSALQKAEHEFATGGVQSVLSKLGVSDSPQETVRNLLLQAANAATDSDEVLPAIDADFDSASLAGLLSRLDLANARGALFDEWRQSKLAADDLKSILDLQARQRLFTQNQISRPFELDLDESSTELSFTLDTPLNRRAQRNTFREQLLNYQSARRGVMAMEDTIKLDIRTDLRSIRQSREQHELGIASAALAYERVISTELQLRLGVQGVAARDYLEAQTAYANSLSTVASRHIGYLVSRISLFTDLEQLQLDSANNWAGLYEPHWEPDISIEGQPYHDYGQLPENLHYSKELLERSTQFWGVPATDGKGGVRP
ncbi:MAG: hypothetical protein KDA75_00340 [Planctomycetaceae bacterium]|nr:hypothetical protein [Planctomycetaceae bacterium]